MDHSSHSISHYMPHGHCYLWEPGLVGVHVVSDLLIGLAYVVISISLYLLIRKIKMPFSPIVLAFGVFIGACGMTHFMEIWNLWNADYWMGGWVKVVTAVASVATGIALFRLTPKILAFAEAAKLSEERGVQLEAAYNDLEARVLERTRDLELATERERESRREAEALYETAQNANRIKDEFLATMSHELRTPLSVILGYSELLSKNEMVDEADTRQAILTIRRNALTQSQLVNDLLDVSMIMSGKMQLDSKIVDLREPIEHAIESVNLAAKAKNIEVEFEPGKKDIPVFGDTTRLQQVVWNLLSNAIKFTDRDGKITIFASSDTNHARVEVVDTGIGIDPKFLPHVFERFRQEDASSSRKFGGLGLGLGIVRHLTELHGGTVDVQSEGRNKGAKFTINFPLAPFVPTAATATNEKSNQDLRKRLKGLRVLVVEDEEDVRDLIVAALGKQGLVMDSATTASEALAKLSSFKPHVLVSDIGLPETDGYALIRMVRDQEIKDGGFVPAIALTAYAQEGIKQRVLASGYQSYITKPAHLETLLKEIGILVRP